MTFLHPDRCFEIALCHSLSVCMSGLASMCACISQAVEDFKQQGLTSCELFAFSLVGPSFSASPFVCVVCAVCTCIKFRSAKQDSGNPQVLLFSAWWFDLLVLAQIAHNANRYCLKHPDSGALLLGVSELKVCSTHRWIFCTV